MTLFGSRRQVVLGLAAAAGLAWQMAYGPAARAEDPDRFLGLIKPVMAAKPLRIGVTVVHLQDDYWKGMAYGITDEAKRSGLQIVQVGVAGAYGNVSQQFAQIQTMKTKGMDVLILGPSAYDGFDPILTSLKKAGIMVIAGGIPVNSKSVDFGVVQDDTLIGKGLGDFLCHHKGDGPAKVLSIPGPAGAEWAHLRNKGMHDAATACPGMTVVDGPVGGSIDIAYALGQASDLIQKNPDAKFFFTPEVALGMGAAQAVKQRHAQIGVVTSTVVKEVFPMLADGELLADSTEPSILMGRLMVQYAIRKAEGMPMPNLTQVPSSPYPTVVVPAQILTKETAPSYPYQLTDVPPKDWSIQAFQ
jgi:ribose transport system substrate-binding protein